MRLRRVAGTFDSRRACFGRGRSTSVLAVGEGTSDATADCFAPDSARISSTFSVCSLTLPECTEILSGFEVIVAVCKFDGDVVSCSGRAEVVTSLSFPAAELGAVVFKCSALAGVAAVPFGPACDGASPCSSAGVVFSCPKSLNQLGLDTVGAEGGLLSAPASPFLLSRSCDPRVVWKISRFTSGGASTSIVLSECVSWTGCRHSISFRGCWFDSNVAGACGLAADCVDAAFLICSMIKDRSDCIGGTIGLCAVLPLLLWNKSTYAFC